VTQEEVTETEMTDMVAIKTPETTTDQPIAVAPVTAMVVEKAVTEDVTTIEIEEANVTTEAIVENEAKTEETPTNMTATLDPGETQIKNMTTVAAAGEETIEKIEKRNKSRSNQGNS